MGKCFVLHQSRRPQRRINGLQLPLNYQQVSCWIVFVVTAVLNLLILAQLQFEELKIVTFTVFLILYASHAASHFTATVLDPSEDELRKLKVDNVPEFDRSIHAHVIENGRCHLCNIHTSSRMTKHCSLCNKCVDQFDHHCKWLNNCVGQRNYTAFVVCVCTALFIAILTSSLCITDIVLFATSPEQLSDHAQKFLNCSSDEHRYNEKYCKNSIIFLIFLVGFCISALVIAGALLHLCCFHVYIYVLGISTYEYIVQSGNSEAPQCTDVRKWRCCKKPKKSIYNIGKQPNDKNSNEENKVGNDSNSPHNETNVGALIGILINNELENRARKMFLYDKNKIHPATENT